MGALTLSDLTPMAGEPRVRDLRLAEALGYDRARDLRKMITRNAAEILTHGPLPQVATMVEIGSAAQRPVDEYHLNEAQALLVCMFARTATAAAVRKQVIEVFLAWRRGALMAEDSGRDLTVRVLERLEARLSALEATGRQLMQVTADPAASAAALTHAVDVWDGQSKQRRPAFWSDVAVRGLVLTTHRQMTVDEAHALIVDQMGPERTPSRSAIHRFWQRLDRLRGAYPSLGRH